MRRDPHSYNDDRQPETESLDWKARFDFDARSIDGDATLTFKAKAAAGPLDLDTRDLVIDEVTDGSKRLEFTLHPAEPILGARLSIQLPSGSKSVRIRYRTSPKASALQWLSPEQTAGGKKPFL